MAATYGGDRASPSGVRCGLTAGFPHQDPPLLRKRARGFRPRLQGMSTNVLIIGGGPAALEAALALHRLAGERVRTTVLAPENNLTYRQMSVLAPFSAGSAPVYPMEQMAADAGFTHVQGRLGRVDAAAHTVTTVAGERMGYDTLLIASGAHPVEPFPAATAFTGSLTDQERLHGIVQDVEE